MTLVEELGIDVMEVLTDIFGLEGQIVIDNFRIMCPNPEHDDKNPSCYVLLKPKMERGGRVIEPGTWNCFVCHAKGNLISLGRLVLGSRKADILKLLEPGNTEARLTLVKKRLIAAQHRPEIRQSQQEWEREWRERSWLEPDARDRGAYEDGPHSYLLERGFSMVSIRRMGARYIYGANVNGRRGQIFIRNTVALPIEDRRGSVIAWCYRRTDRSDDWQPKYLYTLDSPRSHVWIGEKHNWGEKEVALCEGLLDAAWLDQCGIPALAVGGSGVNEERVKELCHFDRVTLFFDRDQAGQWAAQTIGALLWNQMPIYVARYKRRWAGTDPQSLDPQQVSDAVKDAISWPTWQLRMALREKDA